MPIMRIIDRLCGLVTAMEQEWGPCEHVERLDRLIDAMVALALPTLAANDDLSDELCPTCGAPLVTPETLEES